MVKDKVGLYTCTAVAAINAIVTAFTPNPMANGLIAVTFALLAIAWAPKA